MFYIILNKKKALALRLYVARSFNSIYGENHVKKEIVLYHFFSIHYHTEALYLK